MTKFAIGDLVRWVSRAFPDRDPRSPANGQVGLVYEVGFTNLVVEHPQWRGTWRVKGPQYGCLKITVDDLTDEECAALARWRLEHG